MIERAGEIKIATHAKQSSLIVVSGLKSSCGSKVHWRKEKGRKKASKNTSHPQMSRHVHDPPSSFKNLNRCPLTASSRPQVDRKSEDLESLEKVRLPLTLNLSQCLLELQQHQRVVELNDKLLEKHKGSTNFQISACHLSRKRKTEREPPARMVFSYD